MGQPKIYTKLNTVERCIICGKEEKELTFSKCKSCYSPKAEIKIDAPPCEICKKQSIARQITDNYKINICEDCSNGKFPNSNEEVIAYIKAIYKSPFVSCSYTSKLYPFTKSMYNIVIKKCPQYHKVATSEDVEFKLTRVEILYKDFDYMDAFLFDFLPRRIRRPYVSSSGVSQEEIFDLHAIEYYKMFDTIDRKTMLNYVRSLT